MTDAEKLKPFLPAIIECADRMGEPRARIAGLVMRESGATWAPGYTPQGDPRGTGDHGFGHGLCQIDSRTWGDWLKTHDWGDPKENIGFACHILLLNRGYLKALVSMPGVSIDMFWQCVYAAYNCGPTAARRGLALYGNPDHFTAGGDYSADVWRRSVELAKSVPELVK